MNLKQGICALLLFLSGATVPAAASSALPESDDASAHPSHFVPRPEVQTEQRGNLRLTSVLARGGAPYPGTRFTVLREEPGAYGKTRRTVLASSDPQTHIDFDLSPGRYLVQARNGEVTRELAVEVPATGSLRQAVILDAGELHLSSSLNAAGEPAERTWFRVLRPDTDSYGRPSRILVAGKGYDQGASFVLPAGEYIVEASYGDARAEVPVRIGAGGVQHSEIVLDAGRLELFTTLVADGERIGATLISVHRRQPGGGADHWVEFTRAEHTGGITFVLPQGDYLARARLGQARVEIPVQVTAAETRSFELPLNAGEVNLQAKLQGHPEPLLEAAFRLRPVAGPADTGARTNSTDGQPGVAGFIVPAGRYLAGALVGAAEQDIEIEVEPGTSRTHTIELEAGRVSLRMAADETATPYPDNWFSVYRVEFDAHGQELRRRVFNTGYYSEAAVVLPAGRYIAVARNHRRTGERAFTLDAGEVTDLTIVSDAPQVDVRTATARQFR